MDVATELRKARADMIGTADESLYRACHSAADELDRLRAENEALREVVAYLRAVLPLDRAWDDSRRMADGVLTPNAVLTGLRPAMVGLNEACPRRSS